MPWQCSQCTETPGETYTEQFKAECLKLHRQKYQEKAREVMMLPHDSRRRFYHEYEIQRGKEDTKLFIEEVNRQWNIRSK